MLTNKEFVAFVQSVFNKNYRPQDSINFHVMQYEVHGIN
jgi:hypothetical protein